MNEKILKSLKSTETEDIFDLYIVRPICYYLAEFFNKFGIHPNTVTIWSMVFGAASCFFFAHGSYHYESWAGLLLNLVGILLLMVGDILDCTDGQLARMTNQYSRLGRVLDGASGDVWFLCIYVSISLRSQPEWGWLIWVLSLSAGYCHSTQAALADYYRQFHLFFVKGKEGSEWDDSSHVEEEYKSHSFASAPLYKMFLWVYLNYTRSQESATPNLQAFRKKLVAMPKDETLYSSIIAESRPLMKYCNILTFNCLAITLFVTLMFGMPWLYFMVELTLGDLLYLYLWRKHEKMCARYSRDIQG
jgi:phosphatidylglycerophosphate synthase